LAENDGRYQVSNLGRVRNVNWRGTGTIKEVKPSVTNSGYLMVPMCDKFSSKTMMRYVHRLVAQAFIPNPESLPEVDHIDNNPKNNAATNLRWVSRHFNVTRSHAQRLRKLHAKKESHLHQFVKGTFDGKVSYFKNANQCSKYIGCANVNVIKTLRGDIKTIKGWKLEYVDRSLEECRELNEQLSRKLCRSKIKTINLKKAVKDRKAAIHEHIRKMKVDYENERHYRVLNNLPKPENYVPLEDAIKNLKHEARIVLQIDENGQIIKEWKNLLTAETETGICGIKGCLYGFSPSCGGFVWKFKKVF